MLCGKKVVVLTGYDDCLASVGTLTVPRTETYAALHGFDIHVRRTYHARAHPSYQKVEEILSRLEDYETAIWIDADAIITNISINPLLSCMPGINVSMDWGRTDAEPHFSMGVAVVTEVARPVLDWLLTQTHWFNIPNYEQSALQEGVRNHPWIGQLVHVHPRRLLNSVDRGVLGFHKGNTIEEPWEPGDWLCHLTGRPNSERLKQLNRYFQTGGFDGS